MYCCRLFRFPQVLHEQLDVTANGIIISSSSCDAVQKPTVLHIAHELSAIAGYEGVIVMSAGRVVESGHPTELAAQQGSRFAAMLAQAGHTHSNTALAQSNSC